MKHTSSLAWLLTCGLSATVSAQLFTVQVVGQPPAPPLVLVAHGDEWRYHKGTNYPGPGWQTDDNTMLDNTWLSGRGGFGYSTDTPDEVALCQTLLTDVLNGYSTLYLRREFTLSEAVAPSLHLLLTMDWDDGFVAWLDGVELQRALVSQPVGLEPTNTAFASGSHESSRGTTAPVNPPVTYDLGPVNARLGLGRHVLAILGLNNRIDSTDLVQIADLSASDAASGDVNGKFVAIVHTNQVLLSATNTHPGAMHVTVDGVDAAYDPGTGTWSKTQSLAAGFNRLLLQTWDNAGVPLYATNKDVVVELAATNLGGLLASNVTLSGANGIIHVTNSLLVPPGGECTIEAGTVFLLGPGASLLATNATLRALGREDSRIYFLPSDGTTVWGALGAAGTNAHLVGRHLETCSGHLELFDGATGEFEDSYIHDYTVSSPAIIHTLGTPHHTALTLRRCHVANYWELLLQVSTNQFEDTLFEHPSAGGDGIDFDAGQAGSFLRRCTVRHGRFFNVDALDMGEYGGTGEPTLGTVIDHCLLYDFDDKGVSMGVQVDVTVSNTFIHDVDTGIAVKDDSIAGIYHCTIVSNNYGFSCYNKANPSAPNGGGYITNSFNNILWNNRTNLSLRNGSTLAASYSDFQGTNYPGTGNISADPLFRLPEQSDCRLASHSPARGAGLGGTDMGTTFPVGCPMALSHPHIESIAQEGPHAVLRFWADCDRSYSLLASDTLAGGAWTSVATVFPTPLPRRVALTNTVPAGATRFYRLVSPAQP